MDFSLSSSLVGSAVISNNTIRSVATRTFWAQGTGHSNGTTDLSETSRITYYANENIVGMQVLYSNICSAVSPLSTNAISIKASVEYAGVLYPIYFNNVRTRSAAQLENVFSDKVSGLSITKGSTFYIRTYVSVSATQKWPRNFRYMASTEGVAVASDYTDVLTSCPTVSQMFGPTGVFGKKTGLGRTIAINGDSISMGFGVTSNGVGPFVAAFDGTATGTTYGKNVAHMQLGLVGEKASEFNNATNRGLRDFLLNYATHSIYEYGINDVRGGSVTLASMQSTALANWQILVNKKIKVWACTLTPNTTSTDSWATTTNQTYANATGNTVRIQYNNWLRSLPSTLLTGIIETADTCESSRNSGLWKVGYTSDGLHPNAAGFAAYKAVVDPNIFT